MPIHLDFTPSAGQRDFPAPLLPHDVPQPQSTHPPVFDCKEYTSTYLPVYRARSLYALPCQVLWIRPRMVKQPNPPTRLPEAASRFSHTLHILPVVYQLGPLLWGQSAEIRCPGYRFGSTRSRPRGGSRLDVCGRISGTCLYVEGDTDGPNVEAKQVRNAEIDICSD